MYPEKIKKLMESLLSSSLKALQTDYIDIMLVHNVSKTETIANETVMEFLRSIKKKGIIRAHGFSSHNEIELLKFANESKFYDIIMNPYNHKGAYVHMMSGSKLEWDQPALEIELKKAHKNNMGIISMKTCSGGPYPAADGEEPSFAGAIKWVLDKEYVHAAAVAMANLRQIKENVIAMI
ncbi:aldo/keto reductase [candidate division KSB1 bacterium]